MTATLSIHTFKDKCSYALHYGAMAALFTGMACSVGNSAALLASVGYALLSLPIISTFNRWNGSIYDSNYAQDPALCPPRIPVAMDEMSRKLDLGFKPLLHIYSPRDNVKLFETPYEPADSFRYLFRDLTLFVFGRLNCDNLLRWAVGGALFKAAVDVISGRYSLRKADWVASSTVVHTLEKIEWKFAGAKMFAGRHTGVVLLRPLFSALPEPEQQKAILGHELGHVAAGHIAKGNKLDLLRDATIVMAAIDFCAVLAASPARDEILQSGVISLGLARAFTYAIGLTASDEITKTANRNVLATALIWSVAQSASALQQPDVLIAGAAWGATALVTQFIFKHYLRSAEYQADRIAATLVEPDAMSEGLRHMYAYNNIKIARECGCKPKDDGLFTRLWARASQVFNTHPTLDQRCQRLNKMKVDGRAP